jgi:hypothetical protein
MPFLSDNTKNKKAKNSDLNKYTRVEHKKLTMSDNWICCRSTVNSPKEIAKCAHNDTTFSRVGAGENFCAPQNAFLLNFCNST